MATKKQNAAITPFLAAIGNRSVSVKGKKKKVSNYELLANQMWDWAMGWTEQVPVLDEEGAVSGYKPVYHPPDKTIAKTIYDRMEGKPKPTSDLPDDHVSKPVSLTKRLDAQITARLNNNFGGTDGSTATGPGPSPCAAEKAEGDKADSNNAVPDKQGNVDVHEDRASSSKAPHGKPSIPPTIVGGRRQRS